MSFHYFAFGSNLDPDQIKERCPDVQFIEKAVVQDFKLLFVSYSKNWGGGLGTIVPQIGSKVEGFIYELSAQDILKLDQFERGYAKTELLVHNEQREIKEVFTYRFQGNIYLTPPSESYIGAIRKGYEHHSLDLSLLKEH